MPAAECYVITTLYMMAMAANFLFLSSLPDLISISCFNPWVLYYPGYLSCKKIIN